MGALFDTEIWITRNFWLSLQLGRKFGTYSAKIGMEGRPSNSVILGRSKVKIGYRYLPMNFFYGPQINAYTGFARYHHELTAQDNFTGASFKGLLAGLKGVLPLNKLFRFSLMLDFIINSKYQEDISLYGNADSVSSYQIEIAGEYNYAPSIKLLGNFSITSNSANIDNNTKLTFKEISFKTGMLFNF